MNQIYWGRPITGYGDIKAQLLMIGLAPAAHGGNRTGRVFTGDQSSDFDVLSRSRILISRFVCMHNLRNLKPTQNGKFTLWRCG